MRKKCLYGLLLLLALSACGTSRRRASAPVQLPLEDPVEIAASQQRAQEVMDSIDRVRSGAPPVSSDIVTTNPVRENLSDRIIAYARSFTGTPYKLGAPGPKQFDCSSFTSYVFRNFGYDIPAYSLSQFRQGREVESYADLQKGDLVFFGKRGSVRDIGHVGIVVSIDWESGSFNFIHASVSRGVTEDSSNQPYFQMRYMGARRILPDE